MYALNEDGEVHVLKIGPKYEELAVNRMNEPVLATPAASGDMLFISTTSREVANQLPLRDASNHLISAKTAVDL